MKQKGSRKSIRHRWMVNSITLVVLVVVVAVAAFTIAMTNYYYSTMRSGMANSVEYLANWFSDYDSASTYLSNARSTAAEFTEKDRIELQFLNSYGKVQVSTSDLTVGTAPATDDIARAIEMRTMQTWRGKDPRTGERILSVSYPVVYNSGSLVGVIRQVTSLKLVDRQLSIVIAVVLSIAICVMALVYFSNLYFIRSILEPVANVTDTAKRIAAGSYGVQMEKKYDDEIGDLTDAINDMSMKINQAEKTQSEFISSVSHELRTPLTAINGWAETLYQGELHTEEAAKKGMGIIVSEARRLTNMVEELLEFSRIEDGRFTLSVEPIDIKAELEDAVYTYQEFFRRKGIDLQYDECEEEFPLIDGDPQRLRQVFCNLLDNADKHGGSGMRVDVSIRPEGGRVLIRIRDYGAGIPEEELPRVKYKFYKGSSKARGSGIGLAVCDEIIARHNGELTLSNAEGGGCVVTVLLPMRSAG